MPEFRSNRVFYGNLESLRGLAAVSVVLVHCLGCFASPAQPTPLQASLIGNFFDLFNGRNAVVLFFVLSGFVLAESVKDQAPSLRMLISFLVRRAFRILPLAYLGLGVGIAYLVFAPPHWATPPPEVLKFGAGWFTAGFGPTFWEDIRQNFLFISNHIVVVYWTLYIEIVGSILFVPWLIAAGYFNRTFRWLLMIPLAMIGYFTYGDDGRWSIFGFTVLPAIAKFFFCFHLGILINQLRARQSKMPSVPSLRTQALEGVMTVVGILLVCYAHSRIAGALHAPMTAWLGIYYSSDALGVILEALGAALATYGCTGRHSPVHNLLLGNRPLIYLGKLSFGIYAIHTLILKPVFVLAGTYFSEEMSQNALFGPMLAYAIVIPLTIVFSHILYYSVEVPGIRLGRRVANWVNTYRSPSQLGSRNLVGVENGK